MLSAIDEAKNKAQTFQQEGARNGPNQQGADNFLAANAASLKKAGAAEGPQAQMQAADSNPGSQQMTQESDQAPETGGKGNSGVSMKELNQYDWRAVNMHGNEKKYGEDSKRGRLGGFHGADVDNLREMGASDKQIAKFINKNVDYAAIGGGVKDQFGDQIKGPEKVDLADYDYSNSGLNNSFDRGNHRELQAMGYSKDEINDYLGGVAGKNNKNIGEIGGVVQRRTGIGVRTDLTPDNIGDYNSEEIGRSWQEGNGRDNYSRAEMQALARHNEGLTKEDVANEFLKRQHAATKEDYEGDKFAANKNALEFMEKHGTWSPDGEADPGPPEDDPTPDPTEPAPTPDPTEPAPTPTPDPTPEDPAPSDPSVPEYPVNPPGEGVKPPQYGYVPGNPYSKDNQGYYYGTQNQQISEERNNQISANAANAMANGLADIETWQTQNNDRMANHDSIMRELYKQMGLIK